MKRSVNKKHLRFVASHPCCVCRRSPCQAHHPISCDSRRKFGKSHDWEAVPLCPEHHAELHDSIGSEEKFKYKYDVNFHEVAFELVRSAELINQS